MATSLAPPPPDILETPVDMAAVARRRGPAISLPVPRRSERLLGGPLGISLAVHLAGALALGSLLRSGSLPLRAPPPESGTRIEFIDIGFPSAGGGGAVAEAPAAPEAQAVGAAGGTAAPTASARRSEEVGGLRFPGPPPVAPGDTRTGDGEAEGESTGGAGGGGIAERLRPGFRDPRLYVDPSLPGLPPRGEKSPEQRYAEHIQRRIQAVNDSMYGGGPDTDWTRTDKEGRRWGVSEKGLHLGGLTIPREVLPLPRSTGSNATQEAAREKQRQRDEIRRQEEERERRKAQQESTDETRARKDAEREKGSGPGG